MKILITGHEGFIGGVVYKNIKHKAYALYNIDCIIDGYDIKSSKSEPDYSKYDIIMHFGGVSSTTASYEEVMKHNYEYTKKLVDICIEKRILLQISSSASMYSPVYGVPSKESDILNPKSPYSISKYMIEKYCEERKHLPGYRIQIFRYFNVWSVSEERFKNEQASPHCRFIQSIRSGRSIKLFKGSDSIFRDFVHIHTLLDIQSKFLFIDKYDTWNIGSGEAITFEEVVKYAEHYNSKSAIVEYIDIPENLKKHYQYYTRADMTKTYNTLDLHYGE